MDLIDLPRRVVGGALRIATIPLRIVLGGNANEAAPTPPAPAPRPEPETREKDEQASALRDAVKPDADRARNGQELKDATDRVQAERKRATGAAE